MNVFRFVERLALCWFYVIIAIGRFFPRSSLHRRTHVPRSEVFGRFFRPNVFSGFRASGFTGPEDGRADARRARSASSEGGGEEDRWAEHPAEDRG